MMVLLSLLRTAAAAAVDDADDDAADDANDDVSGGDGDIITTASCERCFIIVTTANISEWETLLLHRQSCADL